MVGGLLGKKIGMTQVWDDNEVLRPATVLEVGPCVVLQVKTVATDGYRALQLGFADQRTRRKHGKGERRRTTERRGATRAEIGHARKVGTTPKRFVREVRVGEDPGCEPGEELTLHRFAQKKELEEEIEVDGRTEKQKRTVYEPTVRYVDVIGVTKGKGFQGTVKRHGFSRGPETHGSMNVRKPGSIGQSASPSRVFPGTRMAGHMGHVRHTEHNLRVLEVDPDKNLLVVGGAVPGPAGGYVVVRPAKRLADSGRKA